MDAAAPPVDAAAEATPPNGARAESRGDGRNPARTNRGTLDSLSIRRRTTGEDAAARAGFMRRMRIALPVLALVLVAAFFLNTRKTGVDDAFLNDFADLDATPQSLKTANPQFSGVDTRGNPYEITADAALQKPDGEKVIDLESPRAETSTGSEKSVVASKSGVFDADAKRLDLRDGVTFEHAIGASNYVLRTDAATFTIDDQTVVSDVGVDGEGSDGELLKADRMNANNQDGKLVFEGNVSMRIFPRRTPVASGAIVTEEQEKGAER